MILPLIFAAQILTASPAPAVIKAETGQTRTLADVARERRLGKKGVAGGTLSIAGAPVQSAPGAAVHSAAGNVEEAMWARRASAARAELAAAQAALAQADASLPPAAAVGWGARASAAMQYQVREGILLPYRTRVRDAQAAVDALPEQARRAGAYPGWVRGTSGEDASINRGISLAEREKQLNNGDAPLPNRDRDIMPDGTTSRVEK